MKDMWVDLHKELGCYRCKFADKELLGSGPCCTHDDRPLTDKPGGHCLRCRK